MGFVDFRFSLCVGGKVSILNSNWKLKFHVQLHQPVERKRMETRTVYGRVPVKMACVRVVFGGSCRSVGRLAIGWNIFALPPFDDPPGNSLKISRETRNSREARNFRISTRPEHVEFPIFFLL